MNERVLNILTTPHRTAEQQWKFECALALLSLYPNAVPEPKRAMWRICRSWQGEWYGKATDEPSFKFFSMATQDVLQLWEHLRQETKNV